MTLGSMTVSVWLAVPTLPAASLAVATRVKLPAVSSGSVARPLASRATGVPSIGQCQAGDGHVVAGTDDHRDGIAQVHRIVAQEQRHLRILGVGSHRG